MVTNNTVLEQAISLFDEEWAYLRKERRAYEKSLEPVCPTRPDSADATGPSETTEQLLVGYHRLLPQASILELPSAAMPTP